MEKSRWMGGGKRYFPIYQEWDLLPSPPPPWLGPGGNISTHLFEFDSNGNISLLDLGVIRRWVGSSGGGCINSSPFPNKGSDIPSISPQTSSPRPGTNRNIWRCTMVEANTSGKIFHHRQDLSFLMRYEPYFHVGYVTKIKAGVPQKS